MKEYLNILPWKASQRNIQEQVGKFVPLAHSGMA